MNSPSFPAGPTAPASAGPSFRVRQAPEAPAYHQLLLEDAHGNVAQWMIPVALKELARQPVLLWLLPTAPEPDTHACVETGAVQLVPAHLDHAPDLRTLLMQGRLQLNFDGRLLRGYHRLRCLSGGNGQLWQLTPIGHA
ncbi:hypothetical protein JAO73_21740 [Hymenobacter sp. BT523]|uniref:hypothetical protein n=1 Tax=Hymenobacter sp. BT523 TaxID=2795725 RepID=UPI0018EB3C2A|nr:hypothetical protein [Hymenobacter sp. BT523]MBJ6111659.1 hypothetical protein [Hymenobacter sp. BT523]